MKFELVKLDTKVAPEIVSHPNYEYCKFMFEKGSFIAGGAARSMLAISMGTDHDIQHSRTAGINPFWTAYLRFNGGDIDFWFPSSTAARVTSALLVEKFRFNARETPTKSAIEHMNVGEPYDRRFRLQTIVAFTGTPQQVVDRFDLLASKVVFDGQNFYVDPRWEEYDRARTLHVDSWSTPFIFSRINKYFKKHGYTCLSESSELQLIDRYFEHFSKFNNGMYVSWSGAKIRVDTYKSTIPTMVARLADSTALLMGTLAGDQYGFWRTIRHLARKNMATDRIERMLESHSDTQVNSTIKP